MGAARRLAPTADESLADAAARNLARDDGTRARLPRAALLLRRCRPLARRAASCRSSTGRSCAPTRPSCATEGENVRWFPADELPELAFDHNRIVDYALWRLRTKLEYSRIAHAFLGETFTLAELRAGARGRAAAAARPRQLPPPGRGHPARSSPPSSASPAVATARRGSTATTRPSTSSTTARSTAPLTTATEGDDRVISRHDNPAHRTTGHHGNGEACTPELAEGPWVFDAQPLQLRSRRVDGRRHPGRLAAPGRSCPPSTSRRRTTNCTTASAPRRRRSATASSILGHFYQRDEVVQHADFLGDSFQLANAAQTVPNAEAIVFCGVHFMAETADILAQPDQKVILPNLAAGCSMADMADIDSVEEAGPQLEALYGTEPDADGRVPDHPRHLHELVGRAEGLLRSPRRHRLHLLERRDRARVGVRARSARAVLPRPAPRPQHREGDGRAARADADVEPAQAARRQRRRRSARRPGHPLARLLQRAQALHRRPDRAARAEHPGVRVIVHPECPMAVVDAADEAGSTDYIRKAVAAATEPTTFAIGTEINMVNRLAAEFPQHTIFCLDPVVCPCSTMYRIHPGYLAWVLEGLVARRGPQPDRGAGRRRGRRARSPSSACSRPSRRRGRLMASVVVVGTGIAGLITAYRAQSTSHDVILVTKAELAESNTKYAQGGIAAAMFPDDSVASHIADTLAPGAGLCDPHAVEVLCARGPAARARPHRARRRVRPVGERRARPRPRGGALRPRACSTRAATRPGSRSSSPCCARCARSRSRCTSTPSCATWSCRRDGRGRSGVDVLGCRTARRARIDADVVMLASGGAGQLYQHTTNPHGDDRRRRRRRLPRRCRDQRRRVLPVPPDLARGARQPAHLRGRARRRRRAARRDGRRFMFDVHPDGELAPRDVVARGIAAAMARQGGRPVMLDATALGARLPRRALPRASPA